MAEETNDTITFTSEIVSAFVANNNVNPGDIAALIQSVHAALANIGNPAPAVEEITEKATAAQIRKSIRPEGLVSFIDGKPYKTLKRHLSKHGLSVGDYKDKFGLPKDYPTTAADYSARRSAMAKSVGLGQQRKAATASAPAPKARKAKAAG